MTITAPPPTTGRRDPARARGLRRRRALTAPLPDVDATAMPPAVDRVQLYALVARLQRGRLQRGELKSERAVYDVRVFKDALAELAYLRVLAAGGDHGGTILTSMGQLVHGFAALHPAWDLDGDWFEVRDRHQQTVRAHLRNLKEMGLLAHRVGLDLDAEERRTELELLPSPPVTEDELAAAGRALKLRQRRYGRALNTGSRTGITDALRRSRPLSASERQRRGSQHSRRRCAARHVGAIKTVSTPPSGASAALRNNSNGNPNDPDTLSAYDRTGTHTRENANQRPRSNATLDRHRTTSEAQQTRKEPAEGVPSTALRGLQGPQEAVRGAAWDPEALITRVARRQAERAPVLEAIAAQAGRRALEAATWSLKREWPIGRLREAWVVARWGKSAAAEGGPAAAGPVTPEQYVRLRRAVARYERNAAAAPSGWPRGGLAALLHLGALTAGGTLPGGPRLLAYAIGRLDQLSRRMRARATADEVHRVAGARRRAEQRRDTARQLFAYRAAWPPWILLDGRREPTFTSAGELLLNERLVAAGRAPDPRSDGYRLVIRDAHLVAGRPLPLDADGRRLMAARHAGQVAAARRPVAPSVEELELRELAHHTGESVRQLRPLSVAYRQAWLQAERERSAARGVAEARALKDAIAELSK